MQDVLRHHLLHAKQVMTQQADKKRTPREFQVGDQVFLKLQPYIQTSVAQSQSQAEFQVLRALYGDPPGE